MNTPLLSVVIPVFNEKKNIAKVISEVEKVPLLKEIVIVDDRSSDGTYELLRKEILLQYPNISLMRHAKNQGKGAAIRTALSVVQGDIVIIQDADLEYDPKEYPKLVIPIIQNKTDIVYGSRFKNIHPFSFYWKWFCKRFLGMSYEVSYLHHFLGIQFLNLLTNILYGGRITDEATCYKVFRSEIIKNIVLHCEGFEFCPEITAKVRKRGHPILEVPITYHPRTAEEGKKLNWTHGIRASWTLIKYRFRD